MAGSLLLLSGGVVLRLRKQSIIQRPSSMSGHPTGQMRLGVPLVRSLFAHEGHTRVYTGAEHAVGYDGHGVVQGILVIHNRVG